MDRRTSLPFRLIWIFLCATLVLLAVPARAVELRVSREVLERTLKQQLFSGPGGRYYLKGTAQTPCYVYADDAQLSFWQGRVFVYIKTHAKLGTTIGGKCLGIGLDPTPQVSVAPQGAGEIIGFQDAKLEKALDNKEFNFLFMPFLKNQLPSSMQVNAADLLRKALADSSATSGFKVTLEVLKIHSMQIQGDEIVVDFDGGLSVK